jgi:hypothetical protein
MAGIMFVRHVDHMKGLQIVYKGLKRREQRGKKREVHREIESVI